METTSMNDLFDRMTTQELEAYAQTGALRGWFQGAVGGAERDTQERVGGHLGPPSTALQCAIIGVNLRA